MPPGSHREGSFLRQRAMSLPRCCQFPTRSPLPCTTQPSHPAPPAQQPPPCRALFPGTSLAGLCTTASSRPHSSCLCPGQSISFFSLLPFFSPPCSAGASCGSLLGLAEPQARRQPQGAVSLLAQSSPKRAHLPLPSLSVPSWLKGSNARLEVLSPRPPFMVFRAGKQLLGCEGFLQPMGCSLAAPPEAVWSWGKK